ncbi:MAG: hypothetical protein IPM24_25770 [Bryobacterales bacterium]|nr:hypothetical protein [Bryobacterales bacterium]
MKLKIALLVLLGTAGMARAHFVFVAPDNGGSSARVFMNETLEPGLDTKMFRNMSLALRHAGGGEEVLALTEADPAYCTVGLPGSGNRVVHGKMEFGVLQRGEGPRHLLVYYPKAIVGDPFSGEARLGGKAPVELHPERAGDGFALRLAARGAALPDAEITVLLPDGTAKQVRTDSSGLSTERFAAAGRYGAWARFWESAQGVHDGKQYEQARHYATIVFDFPGPNPAKLPEATSSFGAAVLDGWLYVYGGHIAPTHSYSTEAVSGRFGRMRLDGTGDWEELPAGPALQGMNLVAHAGRIYRVGGMAPRNEPGQPADNHSVADAARFDPATRAWEPLPPLPEPRSSHDLVAAGDKLYAVGGWTMAGKSTRWLETIAVLDLAAASPEWTSLPQPFRRRALMAAVYEGKIYVVGGISDKTQVVRSVAIYDPATNEWTEGPDLPEGKILGFSPAVAVHHGSLYASVADGSLLRLGAGDTAWSKAAQLTPRVAHRAAGHGPSLFVLGGAAKGKNFDLIEQVHIQPE